MDEGSVDADQEELWWSFDAPKAGSTRAGSGGIGRGGGGGGAPLDCSNPSEEEEG